MTDTAESVHQRAQRTRLGRVTWARLLVAENGLRWTAYAALLAGLKHAGLFVERRLARLEQRHGFNARTGRAVNYEDLPRGDLSPEGEEGTPSHEWQRSLIGEVIV